MDGDGSSQWVLICCEDMANGSGGSLSVVSVVWSHALSSNSSLGILASPKGIGSRLRGWLLRSRSIA